MTQDPRQIERYRAIVKFLDNTVRNIVIYPPNHPSVEGVCRKVFHLLEEAFEQMDEVLIGVINGVLYINDYLFYESTPSSENVLKVLDGFDIDDLLILKGVTEEDLLKLAGILKTKDRTKENFLKLSEQEGLTHICLKSFRIGGEDSGYPVKSLETYRDAISTMTGYFTEIGNGQLPPLREAENLVGEFMDMLASDRPLLMLLSSIKGYDAYTYQHCVNVGILALLLAEKEGLGEQDIRWASLAGMMHDIGKVRVPAEVINKPGGLTPREWEAVKAHPLYSGDVIRGMGGGDGLAQAVEGHHLHHDGGGYPVRSNVDRPSGISQLISVVDAYDAITTVRAYKNPMSPVEATAFLEKNRGTRFDPHHVDAFLSMLGAYPPGAMVRLTSNEIGMVVRAGHQPSKPTVKMIIDEKGKPFTQGEDIDLSGVEAQGRFIASIMDPALYNFSPEMAFG